MELNNLEGKRLVFDERSGRFVIEDEPKYNESTRLLIDSMRWSTWQRGVGFDIASTNCLNDEEKRFLIKGMEDIARTCGSRKWTDEEIRLLNKIKDYNYHIGPSISNER